MINTSFLEDISTITSVESLTGSTYDDILQMRAELAEKVDSKEEEERVKPIIGNTLVIDERLIMDIEFTSRNVFKQIFEIKGDVDIYLDLNMPVSYIVYMFGSLISIPGMIAGKTTLHIDGASGIQHLMLGTIVDEVVFGSMATVELANVYPTHADEDGRLTFVLDKVLKFWADKGLLTEDEVTSLREVKTKTSVYISSDRISKLTKQ